MDELYVVARRVLLDALEAIGAHRPAVVLVGAQAIYLRVGEADLAVAPYTTDGDLAIDPALLAEIPPLEQVLKSAGFIPKGGDAVGVWITHRATEAHPSTEVAVDLMVPASVSPGKGRRAARLPGHDARAARIVQGLEGAIVDVETMLLTALDDDDPRELEVQVAGPAALLVAKLHKIQDRTGTDRESSKDALDVFRLLRGTTTEELSGRFRRLLADSRSAETSVAAAELLRQQFGTRRGEGVEMAVQAVGSLADPEEVSASLEALATDLLKVLDRPS